MRALIFKINKDGEKKEYREINGIEEIILFNGHGAECKIDKDFVATTPEKDKVTKTLHFEKRTHSLKSI